MSFPFIAADIGNARIKFGLFGKVIVDKLPEPLKTLSLDGDAPQFDSLTTWLDDLAVNKFSWFLASVSPPGTTSLTDWLGKHRPDDKITLLSAADLPLEVRLERPDMVGIDRLLDAVAVNHLRDPTRPAVIVDAGTAVTVDLLSADGAFLGGSILPGMEMSARALHEFTDLLPRIDLSEFSNPPPALGTSTDSAIRSGLYWGTVGAIRELIKQFSSVPLLACKQCNDDHPSRACLQIFLTGGAAPKVAELLASDDQYILHLTLAGIACIVSDIK